MFSKLHAAKAGTPTMGGVLVWGTTALLAFALALLSRLVDGPVVSTLSFLSRPQTYLPLAALPPGEYVVEIKAGDKDGEATELLGFRVTG